MIENKSLPVTDLIADLKNTQEVCSLLMKSPHYSRMGAEGIYAIVETAKSLGVDPMQALGGGLYYVKGKVEMSSRMMNALIRSKKHSITRDKKSDDNICILHGRRADTGDTWCESFSIDDAKRAGLLGSMVWKSYPKDMMFARALSRLARQLFPDVIGNCYVEGELSLDANIPQSVEEIREEETIITEEQNNELIDLLKTVPDYKDTVENFLIKKGYSSFKEIPIELYDKILAKCHEKIAEVSNSEQHAE